MEIKKKKIGRIQYHGQLYDVYWELSTKLVWCSDKQGSLSNFGDAKAYSEDKVLECALKMLELSGQ